MEKRLPVALRAVARFKSAKKGRCDAEDAADEIRREGGRKNHSTLPKFFILHSSFFIYYNGDGDARGRQKLFEGIFLNYKQKLWLI